MPLLVSFLQNKSRSHVTAAQVKTTAPVEACAAAFTGTTVSNASVLQV
jgi:hypothetical protein